MSFEVPTSALTIWQPMAQLVATGVKRVENRSWEPPRRFLGKWIAIHASKKWYQPHADQLREYMDIDMQREECPTGAIIGVAKLVKVFREGSGDHWESDAFFSGPVGWVFEAAKPVPPIPCKGMQGLWRVPGPVQGQIEEAIS